MTNTWLLDDGLVRFLAELEHWWDGWGGNPPSPLPGGGLLPTTFRAFQLRQNLEVWGSAEAYPRRWSAASATRELDTSQVFRVTDTIGQCYGLEGEIVLCRPLGSNDGTIWEVIRGGAAKHLATLTGDLTGSGGVIARVPISTGVLATVTVYGTFATGTVRQGATIAIFYDTFGRGWVADNARCG